MLPDYIEQLCEKWALVGSRVTCVPPPTDTDQDILVLTSRDNYNEIIQELQANRWKEGGDYGEMSEFDSWKKVEEGELLNIILTHKEEWFDTFIRATADCAENNFLLKSERIKCFDKHFSRDEKKVATAKYKNKVNIQKYVADFQAGMAAIQGASAQAVAEVQAGQGLSQGGMGVGSSASQNINGATAYSFSQYFGSFNTAYTEGNW